MEWRYAHELKNDPWLIQKSRRRLPPFDKHSGKVIRQQGGLIVLHLRLPGQPLRLDILLQAVFQVDIQVFRRPSVVLREAVRLIPLYIRSTYFIKHFLCRPPGFQIFFVVVVDLLLHTGRLAFRDHLPVCQPSGYHFSCLLDAPAKNADEEHTQFIGRKRRLHLPQAKGLSRRQDDRTVPWLRCAGIQTLPLACFHLCLHGVGGLISRCLYKVV